MRLRRKKKPTPQPIDEARMREVMKEELALHETESKNRDEKERERQAKMSRVRMLPKSKKMQLLRHLKRRNK